MATSTNTLIQGKGQWADVIASFNYSFALSSISPSGYDVYFTGSNDFYQSGLGDNAFRPVFTKVTNPSLTKKFTKISSGGTHTLALIEDELWTVGDGFSGQLGFGNTDSATSWVQVPGTFKDIVAGYGYSLALSSNGRLLVTGSNNRGQLGLGDFNRRLSWTPVNTCFTITGTTSSRPNFAKIYQPWFLSSTYIRDGQNRLYVTGRNDAGQLGTNDINDDVNTLIPLTPTFNNGVPFIILDKISVGTNYAMGISSNGTVTFTGLCNYLQMGIGNPFPGSVLSEERIVADWGLSFDNDTPLSAVRAIDISCGLSHTWILSTNNKALRSGTDFVGELAEKVDDIVYSTFKVLTGYTPTTWNRAVASYNTSFLLT